MTRVCVLSSLHPWNDNRILYKEVISLSAEYIVELHARADFCRKVNGNVEITGLTAVHLSRLRNICALFIRSVRSKADMFHIHDFDLLPIAVILKIIFRRKVIYDVHENYSHVVAVRFPGPEFLKISAAKVISVFERRVLPILDGCIVAERSYIRHIRPYNAQTILVLNYPISIEQTDIAAVTGYQMVYSGVITEARGALYLIDFMNALNQLGFDKCHLHIVGRCYGENLSEKMINMIHRLGLEKLVSLNLNDQHMQYETIRQSYEGKNIGLAFLSPVPHYMHSVPTKFYEYMQHGLLVIASDFPLWTRFIDENEAGAALPPDNAELAARGFVDFVQSHHITEMCQRNKSRVVNSYQWESEARKLLNFYQELVDK
jgi:glycosyltransferase involved in cell wall biosynthesis